MSAVEQVRIILERTFGFPVAESDAQIVLDRLTELARKEAVEHSVHTDAGESSVRIGYLTPEEDAAIKADNTPAQRG